MIATSGIIEYKALAGFAADNGVAVALVNAASHEVKTFNNNSICHKLNPTGDFSPECSRFCGKAFAEAAKSGKTVGYVCHAGLECRAVRVSKGLVAIAGRTFVKADNYRKATERAISGDWKHHPPAEFFGNVLLTSSPTFLDDLANEIAQRSAKTAKPALTTNPAPTTPEPETVPDEPILAVPEEQPELEIEPEPPAAIEPVKPAAGKRGNGRRGAKKASAWRSFFGSLLKQDHAGAINAILEFIAHQYGFSALIWLERNDDKFENTATYGEMKNRRVRLGIEPDDHRLIEAGRNEMPLELGERGKGDQESRTMYMFPIGVGGELTAAIAVLDAIEGDARKRQIARVCLSLGPQLEILRLREEVARRESIEGAVRRFSDSIKRIDDDDFWFSLTRNAAEMLRAERASLMIYGERSEALEIKAIIGAKNVVTDNEVRHRVARIVFEKGKPAIISDVQEAGLPPAPERGYKTQSFLSCPIAIAGRTIAVMNFTDRACGLPFDKNALELFEAVMPQLAVAIDRATLKDKAGKFEQLSVTDPLTGLLNRRYIEARLMEEIKRSNRHGFPMSFMMLDVDHFKSYNDQYGHPAGDDALKVVANVIRDTLRGADVAARFGGEEFAILLPQTTGEEAVMIAERIRHNIEHAKFPHRRVTASIGVASCSAELCVSADLVSAADKALYEAKRQGRNRVLVFEETNGAGAR